MGFLGVTPLLLFSFLGFESGNSAAGEMTNPAKDVPISIARSSLIAAASYLLPILAILLVVPLDDITGIGGLFGAVATVYTVFGPAAEIMLTISAIIFCFVLVSQGAAWMIISDRMQAMAAADRSFFGGFFGRFHPKLGTPIRVNTLSGVVATIFMFAAMQLSGSNGALFQVVLTIAISTFLLSYLLAIPAAVRLRTKYPDEVRPFKVPVRHWFQSPGRHLLRLDSVGFLGCHFPGTLESLFGVDYNFMDIWGVEQWTFEVFALGTLGGILLLGVSGYVRGKPVRDGLTFEGKAAVRRDMDATPHAGGAPMPPAAVQATVHETE